jgi:hypothetical protein
MQSGSDIFVIAQEHLTDDLLCIIRSLLTLFPATISPKSIFLLSQWIKGYFETAFIGISFAFSSFNLYLHCVSIDRAFVGLIDIVRVSFPFGGISALLGLILKILSSRENLRGLTLEAFSSVSVFTLSSATAI